MDVPTLAVTLHPRGVTHLASWSGPMRYRGLCNHLGWVRVDYSTGLPVVAAESTYRHPEVPAVAWWWIVRFVDLDPRPTTCRRCVARLRHTVDTAATLAEALDPRGGDRAQR